MGDPGIETGKKTSWRKRGLIGLGAAGLGVLAFSQLGGGDEQAPDNTTEAAASMPIDKTKPYYTIVQDTGIGNDANTDIPNLWLKAGSCVQGEVDSAGAQVREGTKYLVTADDAAGRTQKGYVFMGNIGGVTLDPRAPGFTCRTEFAAASPVDDPLPTTPTFSVGETINLRDEPARSAVIWGTLGKGGCVMDAGQARDGMKMIFINTAGPGQENLAVKWVPEFQLRPSTTPRAACRGEITEGTQAGLLPSP